VNAAKLHDRDRRSRERLGWSPLAFVNPKLPKPRTKAERAVRDLFDERFGDTAYKVHIYDVLEAMEEAYKIGGKEAKP
jgi:hypothetical protein